MEVIEWFPDLKSIGRQRLQELADRWVLTPKPRECAVSHVTVSERDSKLQIDFGVKFTHNVKDGEDYHFPMDDLIVYLAEHGIRNGKKREKVIERIYAARAKSGPKVFQRFHVRPGPAFPLFLKCKTPGCPMVLKTQLSKRKADVLTWEGAAECPHCEQAHPYNQDDLHFRPNAPI